MRISSRFHSLFPQRKEEGFTFFEMIFVISIFGIMASVVLFRFQTFNKEVAFDNVVQDLALQVVTAQKAAISGSLGTNYSAGNIAPTYGVQFSSYGSTDPKSKQIIYFADTVHDNVVTSPSEVISQTDITSGEYVSDLCYKDISGGLSCTSAPTIVGITFTRPFPDATLFLVPTSGPTIQASEVFIEIASTDGQTFNYKTIAINSLGKVWVYDNKAGLYGQI